LSYTYEYTYPKDLNAAGFEGPTPINIGYDQYVAGLMSTIDSRELIRAAIQRIIATDYGERVMQPNFGSNLKKMLFEPMDAIFVSDLKENLKNIVEFQEPRIYVSSIDLTFDYEQHTVKVSIMFRYKRTGIEDGFYFTVG